MTYNKPHTSRQLRQFKQYSILQPSQDISFKLSPLLQNIRRNNIHSYFQIQNLIEKQALDSTFQKMAVFNPQIKSKINPMYKTIYSKRNNNKDYSASPELSTKRDKKFSMTSHNFYTTKKIKPLNSIKKHLISSIDFQQIQRNLYKKPDNTTMFEAFCNKIKQKSQQPKRTKTPSFIKKGFQLLPQNNIKQKSYSFDFKIKAKKRFWIKKFDNNQRTLSLKNKRNQFEIYINRDSLSKTLGKKNEKLTI